MMDENDFVKYRFPNASKIGKVCLEYLESKRRFYTKQEDHVLMKGLFKILEKSVLEPWNDKTYYTITGNGIVHVRASYLAKTQAWKDQLKALDGIRIGKDY